MKTLQTVSAFRAGRETLALGALLLLAPGWAEAVDLSKVPQIHETKEQRDARMQWFRDAKFGMFIHWGPCSVGQKEIGWGRNANRPWDINGVQTPRTEDPVYDNYYKQFNPTKYNADAWVRFAKESGMKYMVLIAKHHDGFAQFDSKVCDYNIMATPLRQGHHPRLRRRLPQAGHEAGALLLDARLASPRLPRRRQREIRRVLPRAGQGTAGQLRDGGRDVVRSRRRAGLGQVEVRRALRDDVSASAQADRQRPRRQVLRAEDAARTAARPRRRLRR